MIFIDEDALICDFAETYHIYDFYALPPSKAAVLASGLRDDARIVKRINDQKADVNTILLAQIIDCLRHVSWMLTKDGSKGRNHPEEIAPNYIHGKKKPENKGFDTPEDFLKAWQGD